MTKLQRRLMAYLDEQRLQVSTLQILAAPRGWRGEAGMTRSRRGEDPLPASPKSDW